MQLIKHCVECGVEIDAWNPRRTGLDSAGQVNEDDYCTVCLQQQTGVKKTPDNFVLAGNKKTVLTREYL